MVLGLPEKVGFEWLEIEMSWEFPGVGIDFDIGVGAALVDLDFGMDFDAGFEADLHMDFDIQSVVNVDGM